MSQEENLERPLKRVKYAKPTVDMTFKKLFGQDMNKNITINFLNEIFGFQVTNEEVQDGKSERGDHPVKRLPLRQWMLRIHQTYHPLYHTPHN